MYHTTGFSKEEITELCALVHATGISSGGDSYPPVLGLFKSVVVTLTYLRRNHVQQELAEYYEVSQSTISRAITAITLELARAMCPFTPTAEELLPNDE
jgi:Helix-turn-helix of DDE superfamily endonuclease